MTNQPKWVIDHQHSDIAFKVKHLMISNVKGRFKEFDADINVLNDDFSTCDIDLWIHTASVTTDDDKRDEHLRSADFFDSATYTDISFVSSLMEKTSKEHIFNLLGELTIKDISLPIKLEVDFGGIVTDPWGNEKAGFTIYGKINRKEWGLTWNTALENGGILVGEDISIHCEIQLIKPKNTPQAMQLEARTESETKDISTGTLDVVPL